MADTGAGASAFRVHSRGQTLGPRPTDQTIRAAAAITSNRCRGRARAVDAVRTSIAAAFVRCACPTRAEETAEVQAPIRNLEIAHVARVVVTDVGHRFDGLPGARVDHGKVDPARTTAPRVAVAITAASL